MGSSYRRLQGCHTPQKWINRLTIALTAVGVSFVACKLFKEWQACGKVRYSWRVVAKSRPLFPRYAHTLTALESSDGRYPKVFVIGGDGIVSESLDVHVLDQSLATWRVVEASSYEHTASEVSLNRRWSHTASGVGRSIFVFGGHFVGSPLGSSASLLVRSSQSSSRSHAHLSHETSEILEFHGDTFFWSSPALRGRVPCARCSHTATVVGTRIYIFGGYGEGVPLNDVHILDTFLETWITPKVIGTPPSPRCSHSATLVDHGKRILIYGGYGNDHEKDLWFLEVGTPFVRIQEEIGGCEVVAWSKGVISEVPQPIVLCGPSGVGKSTLIRKLVEDFPHEFGFLVSHTTRPPREHEVHGVHYHFTTRDVMEAEIQEGKFVEFVEMYGNLYGTSIAAVEAVANAKKRCIMDIDVQGARVVKHSSLRALFIFVAPPSLEELEQRLRRRGTETESQIRKRLRNARAELHEGENMWLFDHVIVNDHVGKTYAQLKRLLDLDCSCSQIHSKFDLMEFDNTLCAFCSMRNMEESDSLEHEGRACHTSCALGSKVLIYGGIKAGGRASNELLVLDLAKSVGGAPGLTRGLKWLSSEPQCDFFNIASKQLSTRYNHQAVKLSLDEMLVTGGFDGKKALSNTFVIKLIT